MIKVDLDKIITTNALKAHLDEILYQTEEEEQIFVVTKKGRPRAAIINVDYLEELTGRSVEDESTEYTGYDRVNQPPEAGDQPPEETASNQPPTVGEQPEEVKASPTPLSEQPIGPVGAATGDQTPVETNPPEEENLDLPELDINDLDSDLEETPASPDTTNEQPTEVSAPVEAPATATPPDSASEQLSAVNDQPTEESAVPETPPVEQPVEQTVEQPTEPPPIEMPVPPASPGEVNNDQISEIFNQPQNTPPSNPPPAT